MRDITDELKELRLHGMAGAWDDLVAQGENAVASSKWLIEHLLRAEHTDRAMRSVRHQMNAAKFPVYRDLADFDFTVSRVDQALVRQLATLAFPHSLHCLLAQHLKRVVIQFAAVGSSFAFHACSIQEVGLLSRRLVTFLFR